MIFIVFEMLFIGLLILFLPAVDSVEIVNFNRLNSVSLIWYVYSLILIVVIAKRRNVLKIWIKKNSFFKDLLWALKIFPVVLLVLIMVGVIFPVYGESYVSLDIEKLSFTQRFLFVLIAVVLGPITEELIFRGMVYNFLKNFMKVELAIISTSIIFSLFHPIETFPEILALSMMMNYFYEVRGNLVVSITLHSLNNTVALLSLFILGGG